MRTATPKYAFCKVPKDGCPEYTSGGYGVHVIPGFGQWVLLNIGSSPHADGRLPVGDCAMVPAADVVAFLDASLERASA